MGPQLAFRWPRSTGQAIYAILTAGLVSGIVISLPLWLTGRDFPHLPCAEFLAPFPQPWDAVFLGLTLSILVVSAFLPENRTLAAAGFAGCVLLGLQDQSRWQPWFYQYLLMLAAAAAAKDRDRPALLALFRFIIICGYFWSGFHKLGPGFRNLVAHGIIDQLTPAWPEWALTVARGTGPWIPWLEMAVAAALCFRRTRRIGVVCAVSTHLLILLVLGPLGKKANPVVWPWNAVIIALVILLFWKPQTSGWKGLFERGFRVPALTCIILVALMPGLSLTEKWDRYFSFHLYSLFGYGSTFPRHSRPKRGSSFARRLSAPLESLDGCTQSAGTALLRMDPR
ncbi:MAG: hypothetical protein ACR2OZ_01390 [Verrucomicrobiales bacterium]